MSMNGFGFTTQKSGRKGSGPNRENIRNERTTFPDVARRRAAAAMRQKIADARSPEDQLKALDRAGLAAVKERAKLAKRIAIRDARHASKAIVAEAALTGLTKDGFASKGEERRVKAAKAQQKTKTKKS